VSIELPDYNPSLVPLNINHDPRKNPLAFNTTLFSPNALGTFGTSSRLWVAKTSAGTKNGALLGKVSLNTITASIQQENSGGHEPECAWNVHI